MGCDGKNGWAEVEFSNVDLGDKRLNRRLIKLSDSFSESPESPINQACGDWAETKAAYRFFKNDSVNAKHILKAHAEKTTERAKRHKTVLAIQDTSYFVYTPHKKTEGLGKLSMKKGKHVKEILSLGLIMHSSLAITTEGVPLGLLDQKIISRKTQSEEQRKLRDVTPIEDKESYRWLASLENSKNNMGTTQMVTICDREADIYEFFKLSRDINAPVLVRAKVDRAVNKTSRYAEKDTLKLWDFLLQKTVAGIFEVEIPSRDNKPSRIATMELRFGAFQFNPPTNNIKHRSEKLPDLSMNAIYVLEKDPPSEDEPIEWVLLTNLPVNQLDEALEKVHWYSLRWRIEMYHKVLKEFRVESCRLGDADRLIKYLTVMSIIGWRIFMVTLIARTDPDLPCHTLLANEEWKVLYLKIKKKDKYPKKIPKIGEVVIWIAQLGGFLARKGDGYPGTITLWRGWKRLADLTEGWNMALRC